MNIKELKNQLVSEYNILTELHAHTTASSCSQVTPEQMVEIYKELGYSAVCITNHFTYEYKGLSKEDFLERYMGDFERAEKRGKEIGIKAILGAEIRFENTENDYLIYGVNRKMLEEIYEFLPYGLQNFRKEYKMPDSLFIQAHPFRDDMEETDPALLDGIEVFNLHPNHNSRVGLAAAYARENNFSVITAGSDFHHPGRKHEGVTGMRTKIVPEDSFHLASILKNGDYLFEAGRNCLIIP